MCKFEMYIVPSHAFIQFKFLVYGHTQTNRHAYIQMRLAMQSHLCGVRSGSPQLLYFSSRLFEWVFYSHTIGF